MCGRNYMPVDYFKLAWYIHSPFQQFVFSKYISQYLAVTSSQCLKHLHLGVKKNFVPLCILLGSENLWFTFRVRVFAWFAYAVLNLFVWHIVNKWKREKKYLDVAIVRVKQLSLPQPNLIHGILLLGRSCSNIFHHT